MTTTRIPRHQILTIHSIVSGIVALAIFLGGVGYVAWSLVRLF